MNERGCSVCCTVLSTRKCGGVSALKDDGRGGTQITEEGSTEGGKESLGEADGQILDGLADLVRFGFISKMR